MIRASIARCSATPEQILGQRTGQRSLIQSPRRPDHQGGIVTDEKRRGREVHEVAMEMRQGSWGPTRSPFRKVARKGDGLPDSHRLCRKTDEGRTARLDAIAYRYSPWNFAICSVNGAQTQYPQLS